MTAIHLVVLNFNGRHLLEECLPSVVRAAADSHHPCRVAVVDNSSSDDSLELLGSEFPDIELFHCVNRGLCSYNDVLAKLDSPVVVLLNNDIKLSALSIDPLVEPLLAEGSGAGGRCFMTAPLCWQFDGQTYEGLQTALRWRWGLIQAVSDYPGYERVMRRPCLTASAGAVMAVDRQTFLDLGGFDPLYLPGRLEDLDFAYRGYLAGYHARYVPEALAYHKGEATFRQELGAVRSQELALRNTMLFHWKNLRHPWHVARHLASLPVRLACDWLRAPFAAGGRRFFFTGALCQAVARWSKHGPAQRPTHRTWRAERAFVRGFDWRNFARDVGCDQRACEGLPTIGDGATDGRSDATSRVAPSFLPLAPSLLPSLSAGGPALASSLVPRYADARCAAGGTRSAALPTEVEQEAA